MSHFYFPSIAITVLSVPNQYNINIREFPSGSEYHELYELYLVRLMPVYRQ